MRLLRVLLALVMLPLLAAPAAAGVGMSWWQFFTSADQNITFEDCNARAARALAAAGLGQERHNGSSGSASQAEWFGSSSSGPSSVYISCFKATDNTTMVTFLIASIPDANGNHEATSVMQKVKDGFFGTASATQITTPPITLKPRVAAGGSGWEANAVALRGHNNERFTFTCEPNGHLNNVWGTDVYTDDSTVCSAAVHAGLITFQSGGTVIVEIRPGQASYAGTSRNGVFTLNYDGWYGSYAFVVP